MSDTGAAQAANDAVVTDDKTANTAADQTQNTSADDDAAPELDDDGNPIVADETEELEWDGKKWVLPKEVTSALKPALLRQADYTKKTQEVADARKALDADREQFKGQAELQRAHFQAATKLAAIDEKLAEGVQGIPYDKLDWRAWAIQDKDAADAAWRDRALLIEKRDAVFRELSQKEFERQGNVQRETAKQLADAYTAIERLVPEWKPNSDFERKILSYGNGLGLKTEVLRQSIIQEPVFARELARLHAFDEAAKKQKTQQTFEKTQAAQPVTRVGGNGGTAQQRKTNDPSGDALSTETWVARERERLKTRKA